MGRGPTSGPFVGRRSERQAAEGCLRASGRAWLTGMAGVGKSRLAAEIARERSAVWVDAGGLADGAALDASIAAAVGLSDPRPAAAVVGARCAASGVDLLVLDDVDRVVEPARAWLEALASHVGVVATSRVDLDAEWAIQVAPLPEEEAAALFAELVPRSAVAGAPEPALGLRIARALGGHPLAIGLAAARLTVLTGEELALELGPDLLRDPLARGEHAGVDPLLRGATSSLSAAAEAVLRAAAVARTPLTREPLGAIAGLPPAEAVDALQVLSAYHLLHPQPGPAGVEFLAHPLVAAWIEARTPPEEWRAAALGFGRDLVARIASRATRSEEHDRWLLELTPHVERLVALAESGAADASDAARAVVAHSRALWRLDLVDRVPPPADPLVLGRLLELRARILLARSDDPVAARDAAAAAAAHLDAAGLFDDAWWARGFQAAASLVIDARDPAAAALLDEAVDRETDARARAELRRLRAVYAHAPNGRLEASVEDRRAYLAWARGSGDPWVIAQGLHSLAIALQALDAGAEALDLIEEALSLARGFSWRPLAGLLTNHLGEEALLAHAYDEAVARCEEAAAWLERVGALPTAAHARASATIARLLRGERPPPPPEPEALSRRWTSHRTWSGLARAASTLVAGGQPAPVPDVHPPTASVMRAWNEAADTIFQAGRALDDGDRARARALVDRALARVGEAEASTARAQATHGVVRDLIGVCAEAVLADLARWRFAPDGAWFEPPDGRQVSLASRPVLARLLARLVVGPADLGALCEAGWPGERMTAQSRRNRVHVALSTLRKLGLEALETTSSGWTLRTSRDGTAREVAGVGPG